MTSQVIKRLAEEGTKGKCMNTEEEINYQVENEDMGEMMRKLILRALTPGQVPGKGREVVFCQRHGRAHLAFSVFQIAEAVMAMGR